MIKWVKLKFTCMNLKKFAIHLRMGDNTCPHFRMVWKISAVLNRILLKITPYSQNWNRGLLDSIRGMLQGSIPLIFIKALYKEPCFIQTIKQSDTCFLRFQCCCAVRFPLCTSPAPAFFHTGYPAY